MKKLLKIGFSSSKGFLIPILNFLIITFGISKFGKENWGTLISVFLWIFFILMIINWGNKEYLIRKFSKNPSKILDYFYTNFLSRSLLLFITIILFFYFPLAIAILAFGYVLVAHFYSSLDSLIIYHQKFKTQLIAEISGFFFVLTAIYFNSNFSLSSFLLLYILATLLKIVIMLSSINLFEKKVNFAVSIEEFKWSFLLFLFGFSGWLFSKIDIYLVSLYLNKKELSEYQILITAFIMLQSLSAYFLLPFTKHIYRLPEKVIQKINRKLFLISIPILLFGTIFIWVFLEKIVKINLSYYCYITAGIMCFPCFIYTLKISLLIKNHQENIIIIVNCFALLLTLVLSIFLIPKFNILGALISICITQWVILVVYNLIDKSKFKIT